MPLKKKNRNDNNGYGLVGQKWTNSCWWATLRNLGRAQGYDCAHKSSSILLKNKGISLRDDYQFLIDMGLKPAKSENGVLWDIKDIKNYLKHGPLFVGGLFGGFGDNLSGHAVNVIDIDEKKQGVHIFEPYMGIRRFLSLEKFNQLLFTHKSVWYLPKQNIVKLQEVWRPIQRSKDYIVQNGQVFSHLTVKSQIVDKIVHLNTKHNQKLNLKNLFSHNPNLKSHDLINFGAEKDKFVEVQVINQSRSLKLGQKIQVSSNKVGPRMMFNKKYLSAQEEHILTGSNLKNIANRFNIFAPFYKGITSKQTYLGSHSIQIRVIEKQLTYVLNPQGKMVPYFVPTRKSPVISLRTISNPYLQVKQKTIANLDRENHQPLAGSSPVNTKSSKRQIVSTESVNMGFVNQTIKI